MLLNRLQYLDERLEVNEKLILKLTRENERFRSILDKDVLGLASSIRRMIILRYSPIFHFNYCES